MKRLICLTSEWDTFSVWEKGCAEQYSTVELCAQELKRTNGASGGGGAHL